MTVTLSFAMGTTLSHVDAINCAASPLCTQFLMASGSVPIANRMRHLRHHRAALMRIMFLL